MAKLYLRNPLPPKGTTQSISNNMRYFRPKINRTVTRSGAMNYLSPDQLGFLMNKFGLTKFGVLEELLKVNRTKTKKKKVYLSPLQLEVQRLLKSTIV